jgi:hypothetical protein
MRKALVLSLVVLFALTSLTAVAMAKDTKGKNYKFESTPRSDAPLAPDMIGQGGPSLSSAVADTFHLAWYSFDTAGQPDKMGWVNVELTAQLLTAFHVASSGGELTGGTFGNLVPLIGSKSVWCGVPPQATVPFCGYFSLPGYGNTFDQIFCTSEINADSVILSYTVFWDSEPGYDATSVEWSTDNVNWNAFTVGDTFSAVAGVYDGTGPTPADPFGAYLTETHGAGPLAAGGSATGSMYLRFHFTADGAWSDEDGLWPTDGAITLDDITVDYFDAAGASLGGSGTNGFEGDADGALSSGIWTAKVPAPFGLFADLYPGVTVTQEDPCFVIFDNLWGFFDNPANTPYTCHVPNPLPLQGAMPFGVGGLYMRNEIWSPQIANVGAGVQYNLVFQSYRDLPLDNLQFYVWHMRGWNAGCPGNWGDLNFVYYGGQLDWLQQNISVGTIVNSADAFLQIALGAWDMCGVWCGVYGTGSCHSHAPLIDNVHLYRVNVTGSQFIVRHLDLFQDNFADDGTLTGHARADGAQDIALSTSPTILPADSVTLSVTGVITDPNTGEGPSVYAYVAVWPQGQLDKTGADIEAPETRIGLTGKRYPLINTFVHDGVTWNCFRMDSAITTAGAAVADRFAIDLNDWVFTPLDTICYVFGADDGITGFNYFSRRLNGQGANFTTDNLWEALNSPMEFTILPAGGWERGGDILYVDDSDDRGGPVQLFFDTAFDLLGIRDKIDRYDVLGPSSVVANSLASRVKNQIVQIRECYRKIIWCSGNLSTGLIGDGTGNPEKSDDYSLLFFLLDTHPNNPGLYISGDDVAQEWVGLAGAGAVNMRSQYLTFNLDNGNHVLAGEPVSPLLTAVGPCFIHLGIPDVLIAYGGCPAVNDFDLLTPTGTAVAEMANIASGKVYTISQTTPNAASSIARVIMSGFSYHYIRDVVPGFPPARVEHLRDILLWLQNIVPFPTGIPEGPQAFANRLDNNYPNPFNPTTTIRYSIKEQGNVSLKVYNAAGQLVRTLVNEMQTPRAEVFSVTWDGKNNAGSSVSSGVYFYKLSATNFSETKKMVLLK